MKKKYKEKTWFYDIGMITGMWTWLVWFRPKRYFVDGKFKLKGSAVLCYNHASPYDFTSILMSFLFRRHHIIGIDTIFEKKFNRFIMSHLLVLPIDKENFSIESYKTIMSILKGGGIIDIFPEGALTYSDELIDFKDGPALFALRSSSPLIPIYVKPRKSYWERKKYYIGAPINLKDYGITKDNLHDGTILLQKKMQELKDIAYGGKK